MSQPAPTAKGSLAATPLAHLLIYALDHRLTGTIVFSEPSLAKHAVYFVDGAPAQARAQSPVALLGELVCERGTLDAADVDAAVADATSVGQKLGQVLVERGVLDATLLETLLREQVVRRLEFFATLPDATAYGYYQQTNFLERAGGPSAYVSPLSAVWRVIRGGVAPERVRDLLGRLGNGPLRFHTEAPLGRFDFAPREQVVIDVLRAKPQPLSELVARGLADPSVVELLVYALSALRCFDTGSGTRPVGYDRTSGSMQAADPARPPSPAPSPASPRPVTLRPRVAAPSVPAGDTFRHELAERLGSGKQSYYEVLGVPQHAPAAAIASAFFQLAKRFHPDRLVGRSEEVRDQTTRLFARMTEAHQVLSDATRRKEYDELLQQGEGAAEEHEEVLRVVRAATSYQKAHVLLKRNNLAAAEVEARQALADDPEHADHVALVAWIDAIKPNADLERVLKVLNDCVRMEEMNLRVLWYRGQILKRLGHERRALEDFRTIVERDPRHVDAQRELRLHDLQRSGRNSKMPTSAKTSGAGTPSIAPRRSISPPAPEKGSFFGKFFKK